VVSGYAGLSLFSRSESCLANNYPEKATRNTNSDKQSTATTKSRDSQEDERRVTVPRDMTHTQKENESKRKKLLEV
jgi:hypothetical protein